MTKKKQKILTIIRKSCITGKAIWVSHERSYINEWKAYKLACHKESLRMNQWHHTMSRRKKNILHLLSELTSCLPILGSIPKEVREAAKALMKLADNEPPKQSDLYDHMQETRRQRYNAQRRERRRKDKHGDKNNQNTCYDK